MIHQADIKEHMEVYASCGTKVGKVDHVEGDSIKLTKNDSHDGQHHRIPLSWVAKVHDHIHLSKDHKEVQSQWQPARGRDSVQGRSGRGTSTPAHFL